MPRSLAYRRAALLSFFFVPGFSVASWVSRTPAVRDELGASTATMGLILFGISIGSMTGVLSSAPMVRRYGTRPIILIGLTLIMAGVAAIGVSTMAASGIGVFLGLLLFGAGSGLSEVAINVEGAEVERLLGRSFMPLLHGFFSFGTVVGASLGILFTAIHLPVVVHLGGVALVCVPLTAWAIRAIPHGFGREEKKVVVAGATKPERRRSVWRDRQLLLIGAIVLAMAMAEGSANDWLPLLMVDGHNYSSVMASLVFTGFALAMMIGRFAGGYFINRFGRVMVVRASALCGVIGLALVIFVDNPVIAGLAVLFWGLGASLGFPLTMSAAGDTGGPDADPVRRVSAVATTAYIAFLVGPPLLGFLGEDFGLRGAMIVVMAMVAVAIFIAPAVRSDKDGR